MLQSCIHLRPIKYESLHTDSQARPSSFKLGLGGDLGDVGDPSAVFAAERAGQITALGQLF